MASIIRPVPGEPDQTDEPLNGELGALVLGDDIRVIPDPPGPESEMRSPTPERSEHLDIHGTHVRGQHFAKAARHR